MKFCPHCGQRLLGLDLEEKGRSIAKPEAPLKGMSWFQRHLNWTMVLAWVGTWVLTYLIWFFMALTRPDLFEGLAPAIGLIVYFAVSIPVGWWVLREKNRSPAWLLICWTWFFLLISNRNPIRGPYGRTMADYHKAIELNPNDADVYCRRGDAYYEMDEYGEAIVDYSKAIQLNPDYADACASRGCAYLELGEYNKAIADHNKAIELAPNDALAYYNRGLAYHEKGEVIKAVSDLEKCIELSTDPDLTKDARQALLEMRTSP